MEIERPPSKIDFLEEDRKSLFRSFRKLGFLVKELLEQIKEFLNYESQNSFDFSLHFFNLISLLKDEESSRRWTFK